MGVLKGTKVTLMNQNIKNIEKIFENEYISSILIKGLEGIETSKYAMGWSSESDDFISAETYGAVRKIWTEEKDIYLLINNKLSVSLDHIILFKDDEGIITWDHSKSLRKGYFLFTHDYKFEKIKSIKKIRNKGIFYSVSVSGCPYFFASGYLLHNARECEMCDLCYFFRKTLNLNCWTGYYNNRNQYWAGSNNGNGTEHYLNHVFSQATYSWEKTYTQNGVDTGSDTGLSRNMYPLDSYGGGLNVVADGRVSILHNVILHETHFSTVPSHSHISGEQTETLNAGVYTSSWSDEPKAGRDASPSEFKTHQEHETSSRDVEKKNGGLLSYNNWCQSLILFPWTPAWNVGGTNHYWTTGSPSKVYFYKKWYHDSGRVGWEFVTNLSDAKDRVNVPTYLLDIPFRQRFATTIFSSDLASAGDKPEDNPPSDIDPSLVGGGYTNSTQIKISFLFHNTDNTGITLHQGNNIDGWSTFSADLNTASQKAGALYPPNNSLGNPINALNTYWIYEYPIGVGGGATKVLHRAVYRNNTSGNVVNSNGTNLEDVSVCEYFSNANWNQITIPYS